MTTTTDTASFLLSILQDRYNHHNWLSDSYKQLRTKATNKKERNEFDAEYKKHSAEAIAIYCDINRLDLMEKNDSQYINELNRNYRIYAAKKAVERGE